MSSKDMIFFYRRMGRKILVVLFFIVVFGLPVGWYLFLQAFGENQFALPELQEWDQTCIQDVGFIAVDSLAAEHFPNETQRLKLRMDKQERLSLLSFSKESCGFSDDVYLVGHDGQVRGIYTMNRIEMDRLLAEIDIYLLNLSDGTITEAE